MEWQRFKLERWLLQPCEYSIGGAGITKLQLKYLMPSMDPDLVLRYGITNGSAALRGHVGRLLGVDPAQVLITTGTAEANLLALLKLLEPGDEFVSFVPGYMQTLGIAQGLELGVGKGPANRPGLHDHRLVSDLHLEQMCNSHAQCLLEIRLRGRQPVGRLI